jgi:hypothetical protein
MKQKRPKTVAEAGRKGGKAGRGKSKVRGDAEYYRQIRSKRNAKP